MELWLSVKEGAEHAGVSRDTIDAACERRELHHVRIGGRRLHPNEGGAWIDAWLERHARGGSRLANRSRQRSERGAKVGTGKGIRTPVPWLRKATGDPAHEGIDPSERRERDVPHVGFVPRGQDLPGCVLGDEAQDVGRSSVGIEQALIN